MRRAALEGDTALDRLARHGYRAAYRLMRVYWALWRPDTHGALVALWNEGRILLVKNSYVPYHSLPGGYVRANETGREAAVRELAEEVGLHVAPKVLEPSIDVTHVWEDKRDHVEIFQLDIDPRPTPKVDRREVVHAGWYTPDEAFALDLFPPIWRHIVAHERARDLSAR